MTTERITQQPSQDDEHDYHDEIPELEPKIARILGLNHKYEIILPLSLFYGSLGVVFSIYSLATTDPLTYALYFFPGFMLWTLLEYIFHRWNHEMPKWDVDNHLFHHKFPDDPSEFVFEFTQSVPMYLVISSIFVALSPSYGAAAASAAGFAICYTSYEWGTLPLLKKRNGWMDAEWRLMLVLSSIVLALGVMS